MSEANASFNDGRKWLTGAARRIICHRGLYWEEVRPGFYRPDPAGQRVPNQATRPALLLGFRAALCKDEAQKQLDTVICCPTLENTKFLKSAENIFRKGRADWVPQVNQLARNCKSRDKVLVSR